MPYIARETAHGLHLDLLRVVDLMDLSLNIDPELTAITYDARLYWRDEIVDMLRRISGSLNRLANADPPSRSARFPRSTGGR